MRNLSRSVFVLLALGVSSIAQASFISLMPQQSTVVVGSSVSVDVFMDFSDAPTLGGGIDVFFDDSLLAFDSFSFDVAFGSETAFARAPTVSGGELDGIAFGNFAGLSGPAVVGTIVFEALDIGVVDLMTALNDSVAGAFFSALTFRQQPVDFFGTSIQIVAANMVSEPYTLGLMLMGLAALGVQRRRRSR